MGLHAVARYMADPGALARYMADPGALARYMADPGALARYMADPGALVMDVADAGGIVGFARSGDAFVVAVLAMAFTAVCGRAAARRDRWQ